MILYESMSVSPLYAVGSALVGLSRCDNLVVHAIMGLMCSLVSHWVWSLIASSTYQTEVLVFELVAMKLFIFPGIVIGVICFLFYKLLRGLNRGARGRK
jgi:hypothetical protein